MKSNTKNFLNIHCVNVAVSNRDGTAYLSGQNDSTAFKIATLPSSDVLQQCEITTMKTFMLQNAIQHVDILKLDCEGAEYDIVDGNMSYVSQIVGEYHRLTNKNTTDLRDALISHGFSIKQWTNAPTDNAGIFWAIK